ncbi:expressed unknown protein [Seminavis robusta]|uniref:Uncharacterized protein n=1 Tax=Seminavis robusta TaxID=568900 RepID=A0A9N8H423_9STRA|nr:expressed unknown protein [Seminavis robusta]|eukprot:Sro102_g052230.1 n/a (246) ;mRNA; r:108962-109789
MLSTIPASTGQGLAAGKEDPLLETVVVYQNEGSSDCGHSFKMGPLIDYLHESKKSSCPECQGSIEMVCDGMVSSLVDKTSDKTISDNRLVKFKYRNHLYHLSVLRAPTDNLALPQSWFLWMWHTMLHFVGETTAVTAQERIAHVLRLDTSCGMRILHKGKILYPNAKQSPAEISLQLLDVCDNGGKPLVMGTRMTEKEQTRATVKWIFNLWLAFVKACLAKAIALIQGIASPLLALGTTGREHRD